MFGMHLFCESVISKMWVIWILDVLEVFSIFMKGLHFDNFIVLFIVEKIDACYYSLHV